ncbi:GreA/GreB family elongation factor [Sphingomonas sp. C3-2]|uniref:GreA/GreB family elongation factor n=1 Tax=Sphingomonas sp. C3-2 TaxID=3062169 RepID=UPI00294B8FF7|nr:GreA/GreB family elongation factor [Sphingomonas sp. C3-2]WOK37833.1 GreA/GreB family elongation factor [Sphingomonas sp. C3-2]
MSVAFRRDVDEEHLEPRPELPIPPGPNLVTDRGLALIFDRIAQLEADLEAVAGKEEETKAVERDLRYWRARRSTAQITVFPGGDTVRFGARVRYADADAQEHVVEIVGADEADPAQGRIAFTAPLARALIGAGEGDMIDFAGKPEAIEILEVGPLSA